MVRVKIIKMSKIKRPEIDLSKFAFGTLTKMSDDKFNGKHPNNIDEGYVSSGIITAKPIVGYSCVVGHLVTSIVTEIISENKKKIVFKTLNSTYKLEYIGKR